MNVHEDGKIEGEAEMKEKYFIFHRNVMISLANVIGTSAREQLEECMLTPEGLALPYSLHPHSSQSLFNVSKTWFLFQKYRLLIR